MSLGLSVNKEKNGLLLAYLTNQIPGINLRKLLKIIYLIDEHFMKKRGYPFTWFDYYAWGKGPVAPEVYEIKNGAFHEFVSTNVSTERKHIITSNLDPIKVANSAKEQFGKNELNDINRLIEKYGRYSADELSDLTHVGHSLWTKTVVANNVKFDEEKKKSGYKINFDLLFPAGDKRLDIYKNACHDMELQSQLLSINKGKKVRLKVVTPSEREKYLIPGYKPALP